MRVQRKRYHRDRTSAKPFGRFSSFCAKHNRSFATYDFCRECEQERYNQGAPAPGPEKSPEEKERLVRIRGLADAMATGQGSEDSD